MTVKSLRALTAQAEENWRDRWTKKCDPSAPSSPPVTSVDFFDPSFGAPNASASSMARSDGQYPVIEAESRVALSWAIYAAVLVAFPVGTPLFV
jgi:hypothetical protein